mmetsp:Transcript_2493/g.2602  ORF Transcript_2493/g.2602 Transcript_2493/m.2602 type:complete len:284 (+) Transcript_2493:145-996(+)|eukprot:CAMPEP_0119033966 /NCGR_PEP_ID=MMETSP1177-20130426/1032_1 /TAXON_ID=2985 /ORGANISM="Ochromonas sp, Strain CCMP1899" /LENGTH=283 /DNA_ID=CAMNT_0006991115 /DNA_START=102 /DNA_END=953 /DNA_ORIENTATION=+
MHLQLALLVLAASSLVLSNADAGYSSLCDSVFCRIIDDSIKEVSSLKSIVEDGACIPQFGQKSDEICNTALERFSQEAPLPDEDKINESLYDKKVEDLERFIDAPLHVVYLKQLSLLREKAMKTFKSSLTAEGGEFESMMQADEFFRREAEEATRQNPDWDYIKETQNLKTALAEIAQRSKKLQEVKLAAAKQTQQAMSYLQMQQQQVQALQQQVQGASSPWNIGAAYRVPDSNINLSLAYQQGKANVQVACVPDESASMLGPNGFVNGVTPGNVGLSFNINI